jgi:hypothetical protein
MDFKQVVGNGQTLRDFKRWQPVEPAKLFGRGTTFNRQKPRPERPS